MSGLLDTRANRSLAPAARPPGWSTADAVGWRIRIMLLLAGAVFAAYVHVLHCDFLPFDDQSHVQENPLLAGGLTWPNLIAAFTHFHASLWVPLTWISFMLDLSLFGMNSGAMHAVNVLLHAANALLLFEFLRRATGRFWESAVVAGLFAVHPLNVESVAWVTERKNVLSMFFALLCLNAHLRYVRERSAPSYLLVLVLFALGLLAKPMLVTLPLLLLLLDVWPLQRFNRISAVRLVIEKAPFLLLSLGCCLMTMRGPQSDGTIVPFSELSMSARLSNAAISYVAYLAQTFWPAGLAALYPHPFEAQPALAGAAAVLLLMISLGAWRLRKTHPFLLIGWLWYLGALVPVLGLIQVGPQARADRFVYLPLIGIFFALVWGLSSLELLRRRARWVASGAVAIIVALVLVTSRQVQFWTNGATLFEHTLAVTRDNARAYQNAGLARARLGDDAMARAHYRAAARLSPLSAETWNNLGASCARIDYREAEAIECFRHAIALDPKFAEAHYNLGAAQERIGAINQAIEQFGAAIAIRPGFAEAHYRLGKLLEREGKSAEAMEHLRRAAALQSRAPAVADRR